MPSQELAHSRASGNPASGSPPSRGRTVSVGAATVFFAAALLPFSPSAAAATEPDLAFGAFQQGHYLTAFNIATNRIELKKDPKSMTLLGELYAGGLGVPQNDAKAAEWYKLAADRGDREAMFALAMFRLQGRAGPRDRDAGAKWLAAAAKLGHPLAAYDLALLYMEGQVFPQNFTRAAELLHAAAQVGNPEAQYALGTLYKQGRGVAEDMKEAARLLGLAAIADNAAAQVEYGIALFNGDGVPKNEQAAAVIFHQAALHGNAVAQDRLARILSEGRGAPKNPIEATKWHLISKARGETNLTLDDFVNKLDPATRAAGEKAAQPFIDALKAPKG
jgi:TPR repeat protein